MSRVNLSAESIQALRVGQDVQPILITSSRGGYDVITLDNRDFYIILRPDTKLNIYNVGLLKVLYNYQQQDNLNDCERHYIQLARVVSQDQGKTWALVQRGQLQFTDGALTPLTHRSLQAPQQANSTPQTPIKSLATRKPEQSNLADGDSALTQQVTQLKLALSKMQRSLKDLASQRMDDTAQVKSVEHKIARIEATLYNSQGDRNARISTVEAELQNLQFIVGQLYHQLESLQQFVPNPDVDWIDDYNRSVARLCHLATVVAQTDDSFIQSYQGKNVAICFERNPQGKFWVMQGGRSPGGDHLDPDFSPACFERVPLTRQDQNSRVREEIIGSRAKSPVSSAFIGTFGSG